VTVTGAPTMSLALTGSNVVTAGYLSGSGGRTLSFGYTVQEADVGTSINFSGTDSLVLSSGATITDAASNAATLTLPDPVSSSTASQSVDIDGTRPTITSQKAAFGGTTIDGNVFTFPAEQPGVEAWGGFANMDFTLYPITLSSDAVISFTGSVPSGGAVDVRFKFEFNTFPYTEPSYNTASVTVSGATETVYTIDVPSQGANTFSSFLMYLDTRDVGVSVSDVMITVSGSGSGKPMSDSEKSTPRFALADTRWVMSDRVGAIASGVSEFDTSRYRMSDRARTGESCALSREFRFNGDGTFEVRSRAPANGDSQRMGNPWCALGTDNAIDASGATFAYDASNGTLSLDGQGAYLGKPTVVNGGMVRSPRDIPSQVIYNAYPVINGELLVTIDAGFDGWWSFLLKRVDEATVTPQ